ncbi:MAG: bifunctional 5,10-methylenetetrahydrofolate dehydrogenase/5,10-methenyltetrahydrofolate cyclohydrolase [Candidatus Calescibacterium sp.]|nr:bifunctional 5,10-methylenetetrahydrofolate dehydrogenase/5,10-methenyltetrahydrofolate cyclohydrolase [Candidatus Calescibacterium sp.]MCX7972105.1 bifunctional 5,10-methylenetetrahydrofolate dehydrogenase/5,10-methenyltetrahydrofolate cyclohydrolase [bacterium]MDW8194793.1 bifunctional 5,10-methylenetetrahydrofolate dehydrogenase/5,10-methenyltetrahydrofolate cyclohydrolase [Candidatus Calescibacterium sp.]
MKNKTDTLILTGNFYSQLLSEYKQKITSILNKPEKYTIAIFYFKTKNNNYFSINQEKIFKQIGLNVKTIFTEKESEFIELLTKYSEDKNVIGINVELPLPKGFNLSNLSKISCDKDLDCLNPLNYYNFLINSNIDSIIIPSVANAVLLMLNHYKIQFEKKDIVILGKSTYTGLAIAHLLLKFNSTVQILNEHSKDIKQKCKNADIIISATGSVNLINKEFVNPNSIVIDVGFEVVNGKIKGDVDIESIKGIVKAVSIVPGGIGKLCNLSTVINLYKLINKK